MIPTILTTTVDQSIADNEIRIRQLAESIKEGLLNGTRYVAFPKTHVVALPDGETPTPPDNLDAHYPNETLSLADFVPLIDPNDDFNYAAATGFQYKSPWGKGFFIVYEVQIGEETWTRSVNYGVAQADSMFDRNWTLQVADELLGV